MGIRHFLRRTRRHSPYAEGIMRHNRSQLFVRLTLSGMELRCLSGQDFLRGIAKANAGAVRRHVEYVEAPGENASRPVALTELGERARHEQAGCGDLGTSAD